MKIPSHRQIMKEWWETRIAISTLIWALCLFLQTWDIFNDHLLELVCYDSKVIVAPVQSDHCRKRYVSSPRITHHSDYLEDQSLSPVQSLSYWSVYPLFLWHSEIIDCNILTMTPLTRDLIWKIMMSCSSMWRMDNPSYRDMVGEIIFVNVRDYEECSTDDRTVLWSCIEMAWVF